MNSSGVFFECTKIRESEIYHINFNFQGRVQRCPMPESLLILLSLGWEDFRSLRSSKVLSGAPLCYAFVLPPCMQLPVCLGQ